MPCCLHGGYVSPEKERLLRLLAEAGIELPDGARIHGPGQGMAWRLVDRRGAHPAAGPLGSRYTVRSLAAASRLEVRDNQGWREVRPGVE